MSVNRPNLWGRLVPVTAATALLFTACGSDDPTADTVDTVDSVDTTSPDGMRAPTPIQAASDGSSANAGSDKVSAEMATDMMIAPAYIVTDYVVSPDLPALPDNTTGYVFDASVAPTAEQVSELAGILGVEGEPVQIDDGFAVSWRVGPDDGSAASVVLWDDAMLSWNFNSAWLDQQVMTCAGSGSEPGSPGIEVDPKIDASIPEDPTADLDRESETPETNVAEPTDPSIDVIQPIDGCATPEPPVNVPTAAEAESLTTGYLEQLGVDPTSVTYDTWADDWSASVTASAMLDGVVAQSWGFTFGADAELQYAWGTAATPESVGPYALVDLDTAIARLKDGSYGYGGFGGRGDIAVMSDTASSDATASNEPAIASSDPAGEPPVDIREGEPVPEPMPVEPMPEPEEITVTLVDVQPDLWWVWDVDGSAWLVPAYRFIGDDEAWYTVPAVTDDFLIQTEPPVTTVPADTVPVETVPTDTVPAETIPPVDPGTIDSTVIDGFIGLSLDEFTTAVEAEGLGPVRVAEIDGEPQALTMDLRPGRVNVAVETRDGVQFVTSATVEGAEVDVPATTVPVVPVVGLFEDVAFYPACGTETLDHEGITWYTLSKIEFPTTDPEHSKLLSSLASVEREPSPVAGLDGFAARVAEPGPGDDVGTLVVWADGVARFVSDSGNLDVWLVDDELTYNWVC